jgi:hypothetical protein
LDACALLVDDGSALSAASGTRGWSADIRVKTSAADTRIRARSGASATYTGASLQSAACFNSAGSDSCGCLCGWHSP